MIVPFKVRNQRVNVSVLETDSKYILKFPYNKFLLNEVRNMGEARWFPDTKHWEVAKNSLRTQFLLGFLTNNVLGTDFIRNYYADIPPVTLPTLMPHQNVMAAHLIHRHRSFWAADMGVGKTLAWLRTIEYLYKSLEGPLWVIAPLAPLRAWQYEIKKWKVRLPINFISCDQARIQDIMEKSPEPPQALCIDEASKFKNPSAKRTQLVLELSRLMYNHYKGAEYVAALSGTPSPKNPADWWSEIEIVCPGFIQENSPKRLTDRLAETEQSEGQFGGVFKKIVAWKPDEIHSFYERLKPITVIVRKKDCLNLPEKIYRRLYATPTEETLSAARLLIETESHTLTLLNKLRQLSDGFLYDRDTKFEELRTTTTDRYILTPKDELLISLIEELQDNEKTRVVTYAGFTASIDKLVQLYTSNGWAVIRVDRGHWTSYPAETNDFTPNPNQEQFQDRDLDRPIAFVATADSGGMGLTLHASDTTIYYSNSYNGESRMQSEDRIHRIGTKGANIIDLIHLPLEEQILDKLIEKRNLQELTLGELKELIG